MSSVMFADKIELWTCGHSTRSIEDLIEALVSFDVRVLADVRSFPGSRRYPQFNKENLRSSVNQARIDYEHFPEIVGPPRARPDSQNLAWRNESSRRYAAYMETN